MTPPDTLNAIGVLTRREIEVRLLAPLIDAFAQTISLATKVPRWPVHMAKRQ